MTIPTSPPELARALDTLRTRAPLAMERRLLLLTAGFTALGSDARTRDFFPLALQRGLSTAEASEIILQTHLFAGYPRAINALFALKQAAGSIDGLEESVSPAVVQARGRDLCRRIYGSNYAPLRQNIRDLHPDLDRWMVEDGYGRVLSRPGVEVVTRELAALAALVVLDVPRQIHAHLLGARNVGASDVEIDETLYTIALCAPTEAVVGAKSSWTAVRARGTRH